MRLADTGRSEEHDVVRTLDEAAAGELAHDLAIDRRLEVEVELVERFDPRQPRLFQAALDAALVAAVPLGFERAGEEAFEIEVALRRLLAHAIELREQVLHLHPLEQGGQFHWPTSS
jgi:hypothetical protein